MYTAAAAAAAALLAVPGAYREIFRVLRPGGELQASDICVRKPVPDEAKSDIDLWTA